MFNIHPGPATVLTTCIISSSPHFTEQKTEAQGGKGHLLNVSQPAPEPGYGPAPSDAFVLQTAPNLCTIEPHYVPGPL